MREEVKHNFAAGALEIIAAETIIYDDHDINFRERWAQELIDKDLWLQIVNFDGEVIYSVNTPPDIPTFYSFHDMLNIEATQRHSQYYIQHYLESVYDEPFLFYLGFPLEERELLDQFYEQYNENGLISVQGQKELPSLLNNQTLLVIDQDGKLLQSFGADLLHEDEIGALSLFSKKKQPGSHYLSYHFDETSQHYWLLTSEQEHHQNFTNQSFFYFAFWALLLSLLFVLILGIFFTTWHVIRYGKPLMFFVGWLEHLKNGQYDLISVDQSQKKILNKKGKVRYKYRLFEPIMISFYAVASKLKKSEEEKMRQDSLREEWLAGISHDLRTPLSSIQGYGQLLESNQYQWSQEELLEMGQVITKQSLFMLDLLKDFSLTFELKNNDHSKTFSKVNFSKLAHHHLLKFINDPNYNENSFSFDAPNENQFILGNENLLERLLDNLVSNAIVHNPKETSIHISLRKKSSHIEYIISDTGIGMDDDTQNHLFERYYRGTNTEQKTDGSGLGMSISKAIVEIHQGSITVESNLNQGTTIIISFCQKLND